MDLTGKKIGIWGFGVVGKSAAKYVSNHCQALEILDARNLSEQEHALINQYNATAFSGDTKSEIEAFLDKNEIILVSPGIDTRLFAAFGHKFISELDIIQGAYKKPVIAITGSVGKTTVTHILGHILQSINPGWWIGGNIGTGMLDLLSVQDQTCGAVIEVSSFQLEHCTSFSPHLAIITNIYPNHIDRHGSFDQYAATKISLCTRPRASDQALMPLSAPKIPGISLNNFQHINFFDATGTTHNISDTFTNPQNHLFFNNCSSLVDLHHNSCATLVDVEDLPDTTFTENWLIICAALRLLNIALPDLKKTVANLPMPAHRLEKVATIATIDFYNDSKGTTASATLAAVDKLKKRPIILLLGGKSKGVDRTPLIWQVANTVKAIVVFGAEHHELAKACEQAKVLYKEAITIDQALDHAMAMAQEGDQIVLSPAGSSYDQFAHYQERGDYFKSCVRKLQSIFNQ